MLRRVSLIEELKRGGYEASLITTFNAYLPFYEDVILRRLVNAGSRHNVLMMDERQYSISIATHPPRLAGRQYTLLPMRVPGAFHPKLILLAGKKKGLIAVGSHNMTLAGFGFNRELTNVIRIDGDDDPAGVALAQSVWHQVDMWLENHASHVPSVVTDMVSRVRDFSPWLKKPGTADPDVALLGGRPGAEALWKQLTEQVTGPIEEVGVTGAFFDRKFRFLQSVQSDLEPERFVVAVDPSTVDLPTNAAAPDACQMLNASDLASDDDNTGYLHAKGMLIREKGGDQILAIGSANPSAPAWLAEKSSGNVELMLVVKGDAAEDSARSIGFDELGALPDLVDNDWATIREQAQQDMHDPSGNRARLAVADSGEIRFAKVDLKYDGAWSFRLLAAGDREIAATNKLKTDGDDAVVAFSESEIAKAVSLNCCIGNAIKLTLYLHHTRTIAEQSRTGNQRKLKDALMSLETDSPDIGLLINCIDKIVFSKEQGSASSRVRVGGGGSADEEPSKELGSLEIDVADTKRRRTKQRLAHTGDFSYLLDALIYHLGIQEDRSAESLDRYGRNEEEQIGGDDDDEDESDLLSPQKQSELLDLCHKKVRLVVSRMNKQFMAYADGDQELDQVLLRLLGVLAVVRELRRCDSRASWVEKGRTTVPQEERRKLLEGAMFNLFEGRSSILNMSALGEEFQASDDIARLKGLLLWLAWDCGLTMDLEKPFMESPEQLKSRLQENAMILALAQMIESDECAIDEARQSIGALTATELEWLKQVLKVGDDCKSFGESRNELSAAYEAEPGDVALHKTLEHLPMRIVAGGDASQMSLIRLSSEDDRIAFKPDHLVVCSLDQRMAENTD